MYHSCEGNNLFLQQFDHSDLDDDCSKLYMNIISFLIGWHIDSRALLPRAPLPCFKN